MYIITDVSEGFTASTVKVQEDIMQYKTNIFLSYKYLQYKFAFRGI